MPPKGSKKVKKDAAATTAAAHAAPTPASAPTPKPRAANPAKAPKAATPARKAPLNLPEIFQTIQKDETNGPILIDVTYKGETSQAKLVNGEYAHTLELHAPRPFKVTKTVAIPGGEYGGYQAILLRPAKPFPFLQLPDEARSRVYAWYFAPGGVLNAEIPLESKRKGDKKDVFAKSYAENSHHRVALLAVNKEIHNAAMPVLYANTLNFESTTTLMDFLTQISSVVRSRLVSISIQAYVKTTSRTAMHLLSEAGNLQRLRIDNGIFSECNPDKAAKAFYTDAVKFLEAVAATKGDKTAGVDVIKLGQNALIWKDEQKKVKAWTEEQIEDFKAALKDKLK